MISQQPNQVGPFGVAVCIQGASRCGLFLNPWAVRVPSTEGIEGVRPPNDIPTPSTTATWRSRLYHQDLRVDVRPGKPGGVPLLLLGGIGVSFESFDLLVEALDPDIDNHQGRRARGRRFADQPATAGFPAPGLDARAAAG